MMNPSTFFGYKVQEDPQRFIDEVFKVLDYMGVSSQEKAELSTYQLKDLLKCGMRDGNIRDRLEKVGLLGSL